MNDTSPRELLTTALEQVPALQTLLLEEVRTHLAHGTYPEAVRILTAIGETEGLGSGFWEPLAEACQQLQLDPGENPWIRDVEAHAENAP